MQIEEVVQGIRKKTIASGKGYTNLKVKSLMNRCGYSRRSLAFIENVNRAMQQSELQCEPPFELTNPYDSWLTISLKDSENILKEDSVQNINNTVPQVLSVHHDFFKYLFDFGSDQEYERFQACLDADAPVGIFLIPKERDFFSDVVEKILTYELIRRRQYKKSLPDIQRNLINTSALELDGIIKSDNTIEKESNIDVINEWALSDIFHFPYSTMYSVIVGETSRDILDSEKFEEQFHKLTLFTNKYASKLFFILFHCPSESIITDRGKQDLLGTIIDKVTGKLPYVFQLRCKFVSDSEINCRNEIISHLKLLMEVPSYSFEEDDLPLSQIFAELQKVQIQSESQLLLRIKPEHFLRLEWGRESDEHIYLKYFAINTLEKRGYKLENIKCEQKITNESIQNEEIEDNLKSQKKKRPDVRVNNKIIVEVETLRSKAGEKNVFLYLVKDILNKIGGWSKEGWLKECKEVWLVLPGFEIARNYYQLKKTKEILERVLKENTGGDVNMSIMAPDYHSHTLFPVSFENILYPSFRFEPPKRIITTKDKLALNQKVVGFASITGLEMEKKRLLSLIRLQEKGGKLIRGILLYGLPGCGKTLLANAFANESRRYFFKFSPADIIRVYIGETQKNIKDIFSQAKLKAPSLLFIDELDSIGFSRDEQEAHTDQKASINQMLIELQNIEDHDVIVVAATNRLSGIDTALKRSGRLDWKIPIFPPDDKERKDMFEYYLDLYSNELKNNENINIELTKVNYEEIGKASSKFTSSDIELVCRELINNFVIEEEDINTQNINTQNIIKYVENYKKGGLTLKPKDVEEFIKECNILSIESPKIKLLRDEWEIKVL